MIDIRPTPRKEVRRAWESQPKRLSRDRSRPLNLKAVLDLGHEVYFPFRARAFKIPLLSADAGLEILDLWLEAESIGDSLNRENLPRYREIIHQLRKLMWRNCEPVGLANRVLWRIGLHNNPFMGATEKEVVELTHFFLRCRMRSSVPLSMRMERMGLDLK